MTAFIFDGTKTGLLCCLFFAYYEKVIPEIVTASSLQYAIGDSVYEIESDEEKAERVLKCIFSAKTKQAAYFTDFALKSGEEIRFTVIFKYLKKVIDNLKTDISKNYADQDVLAFHDIIMRIMNEIHRFKGFIRFSESKDGFLYAHYEPDNDITELLMPHFCARLKTPFIIHDTKRNIIGLSDGIKYKVIQNDGRIDIYLSDYETEFLKLWKTYYKSVNIESRKNERTMLNFLPKRYWKNLPEKNDRI